MPGMKVTPFGRCSVSCSAPITVSWSVRANIWMPAAFTFPASWTGVSVPSEAVECICRSIIRGILHVFNMIRDIIMAGWQQLFPPRGIPSCSHFPVGCKQSITQIGAVFNSFFWRPAPVSDEEKYWFTRSKEHDIIPPAKARRPKTRLRAFQEVMFYGIGTYEGSGHGPVGDPGAV